MGIVSAPLHLAGLQGYSEVEPCVRGPTGISARAPGDAVNKQLLWLFLLFWLELLRAARWSLLHYFW